MKTEFLTDWEIAALNQMANTALNSKPAEYHRESLQALSDKLDRCTHIRVTYRSMPSVLRPHDVINPVNPPLT